MSWEQHGECRKHSAVDWYPPRGAGRQKKVDWASRICRQACAVRQQCAAFALESVQRMGIWAGVDLGDSNNRPSTEALLALYRAAGMAPARVRLLCDVETDLGIFRKGLEFDALRDRDSWYLLLADPSVGVGKHPPRVRAEWVEMAAVS